MVNTKPPEAITTIIAATFFLSAKTFADFALGGMAPQPKPGVTRAKLSSAATKRCCTYST